MASLDEWSVHELEEDLEVVRTRLVTDSEATLDLSIGRAKVRLGNPNSGRQLLLDFQRLTFGDRIKSYGGLLSYEVENVLSDPSVAYSATNQLFDVILTGSNITIVADHFEQMLEPNTPFQYKIELLERNFRHPRTQQDVTREQFMMVLVNLDSILVRITYFKPSVEVHLINVLLDTASEVKSCWNCDGGAR